MPAGVQGIQRQTDVLAGVTGPITTKPDGPAAVVADAAYLVPLEQPDAVVGLVRDFWASALAEAPGSQR